MSISPADTDSTFMRKMVVDDVSTREAYKPSARFVLSANVDNSTRNNREWTSTIIDSQSGCSFSFSYTPRSTLKSTADTLPGAPGADPLILSDELAFRLTTIGPKCAQVAMRQDLARARELTADDTSLAVNRASAQALPDIKVAIELGARANPQSRFALTESHLSPKSPSTDYNLI